MQKRPQRTQAKFSVPGGSPPPPAPGDARRLVVGEQPVDGSAGLPAQRSCLVANPEPPAKSTLPIRDLLVGAGAISIITSSADRMCFDFGQLVLSNSQRPDLVREICASLIILSFCSVVLLSLLIRRWKRPHQHVEANDAVTIEQARGCDAKWEQMNGGDCSRQCGECGLTVFKTQDGTLDEVRDLLRVQQARERDPIDVAFRRFDGTFVLQDCNTKRHRALLYLLAIPPVAVGIMGLFWPMLAYNTRVGIGLSSYSVVYVLLSIAFLCLNKPRWRAAIVIIFAIATVFTWGSIFVPMLEASSRQPDFKEVVRQLNELNKYAVQPTNERR